jgi:hypothetical protein
MRFDHGNLLKRDLPRVPQDFDRRDDGVGGKTMTELVTTPFVLLSVVVFAAHAFDAYRAP